MLMFEKIYVKIKVMQKIYCYVDESGQDVKSDFFVVVAVVNDKEQDILRKKLLEIEALAKTSGRKWHKLRDDRRIKYLYAVLKNNTGKGDIYFGRYEKPLPYFLPMLDVLEKSIAQKITGNYKATICVDGIDRKKSAEITNALRLRGISLEMVKSRRDESEPIIRLADMWAGCIRGAMLGKENSGIVLKKAEQEKYLCDLTKK